MSLLEWLKFWSKFFQNTPILSFRIPPQMKIVRESKSESFRIPPQWKLSESPNLRVCEYPPTPQNENCQSPNPRVSEYPPNENCQRVQIQEFQNTLPKMKIVRESKSESFRIPPQWKLSESLNPRVSESPQMKIVRESKSKSFRIPPPPNRKNFRFQTSE